MIDQKHRTTTLAAGLLFITSAVQAETVALWTFDEQVGIYPNCVLENMSPNDHPLVLGQGGQIVAGKFGGALVPKMPDPLPNTPFIRKVVGWSLGPSLATELVASALRAAIEARRPHGNQLLHHSDRGCQYTSDAYQQTLRTLGIECSMSRTGCCYDNAVMERFFWSLKHEWTNHESFQNLKDAHLSVFKYIDTFYNPERLHQTLGYKSPNQFEAENAPANAA